VNDDKQANVIIGGIGLGILTGIALSFILKSSPLIGDCGVNVEINKFYLYVGLFATKLLFTIACGIGGLFAGVVAVGIIESFLYIKKAVANLGVSERPINYIHRKYNYRYFVNLSVDVITEPYIILIAWAIGVALYVVGLRMSPEICYISNETRSTFLLGTLLTVSVISVLAGTCLYYLTKHFRNDILRHLLDRLEEECDDLDSINCKCNTQKLESLFDPEIYTVDTNSAIVTYQANDGLIHSVTFTRYGFSYESQYMVYIRRLDGLVRTDEYHGHTLRHVIKETLKVCKQYQEA